jgi:hypothetical protein
MAARGHPSYGAAMDLPDISPVASLGADVTRSLPIEDGAATDLGPVRACFGIALHMHQPTVLGAGGDLGSATLVSNLRHMLDHPHDGDNHNAPAFLRCYGRAADLVGGLNARGRRPRLMLDYSGNLLWGLEQMGESGVLASLRRTTGELSGQVEWLGTMWSHAVAPSTPVPDLKLQMLAWRAHFASLFGVEAARRVRGFSAPEMHLPIHPDVCLAYVRALRECGYRWLMVQEHSVENLDGTPLAHPHLPHLLVAKGSDGALETMPVLVKRYGSDTKLVGQMQPLAEARSLRPHDLGGRPVPPYALQIGDGENGGVMMNEFPSAYERAFDEIGTSGAVAMNGTEYLRALFPAGIAESALCRVQPVSQHRIWDLVQAPAPGAADRAIAQLREIDPAFHLDRASWTNDRTWVDGYDDVLDPMTRLSARFHERWDGVVDPGRDERYRQALLYLLLSQTSCFRYWGHGAWTDMAQEICRRGIEVLDG